MNHRVLSAAILAASVTFALPALAKDHGNGHGRGDRGDRGGRSSAQRVERAERGGGRAYGGAQRVERGNRSFATQRVERGNRSYATQRVERGRSYGGAQQRVERRAVDRRTGAWSRGPAIRNEVRYRSPRDGGGTRVYSGGGTRTYAGGGTEYRRYRDNHTTYSSPRTRYRGDGGYYSGGSRTYHRSSWRPSYLSYYPRHYYYGDWWSRPRFAYRSNFYLGLSIGLTPSYGYRYWDPYCGAGYSHLGAYYDHCHHHDHPTAILVIYQDAPIGTCVYDEGEWVVDDCGDEY